MLPSPQANLLFQLAPKHLTADPKQDYHLAWVCETGVYRGTVCFTWCKDVNYSSESSEVTITICFELHTEVLIRSYNG